MHVAVSVFPQDHELHESKDHIRFVDYRLSRAQSMSGCLTEWMSAVLLFREADQQKR